MIKSTFLNLPKEKKNRLILAARKEFTRVSYETASINKIIKDAEISRGSFYTYFDTKADLVRYMLLEYAQAMSAHMSTCLVENDGDIFAVFASIFELTLKYTEVENEIALFHSLFKTMQTNNDFDSQFLFAENEKQKHMQSFLSKINTSHLIVENDDELFDLFELLVAVTKQSISKALSNSPSKEQARKSFLYKLQIIKEGCFKA